jgi:nicotinamidase-related amidase
MRALIVVDMQNDFGHHNGSLHVVGAGLIVPGIVNRMLSQEYDVVVLTQDWHPEKTSHWDKWPVHCVQDTWGAELLDEITNATALMLVSDDYPDPDLIQKATHPNEDGYSGFYAREDEGYEHSTGMHELLQAQSVTHVEICGIAGDVCVDATARDAKSLGYDTSVLLPLTVSISSRELMDSMKEWNRLGIKIIGANTSG